MGDAALSALLEGLLHSLLALQSETGFRQSAYVSPSSASFLPVSVCPCNPSGCQPLPCLGSKVGSLLLSSPKSSAATTDEAERLTD